MQEISIRKISSVFLVLLLLSVLPYFINSAFASDQATSTGTVSSFQKISSTAGSFGTTLDADDQLGFCVVNIGDLNGDGVTDLAAGMKEYGKGAS